MVQNEYPCGWNAVFFGEINHEIHELHEKEMMGSMGIMGGTDLSGMRCNGFETSARRGVEMSARELVTNFRAGVVMLRN